MAPGVSSFPKKVVVTRAGIFRNVMGLIAKVLKQKEGAIPLFISCNRDSYRFTGAADGTRLRERCCVPYRRLPTGGPKRLDNP